MGKILFGLGGKKGKLFKNYFKRELFKTLQRGRKGGAKKGGLILFKKKKNLFSDKKLN